MTSSRIGYLDIAKGLGILLVVLGHNDLQDYAPFMHKLIYSFHMPLFFFLSGIFFKPNIEFIELIKNRFNSLIKPYFFSIFLLYFVATFFSGQLGLTTVLTRLIKSLYGTGFLEWLPMWFLPILFITNIAAFALYHFAKKIPNWLFWLEFAAFLVIGSLTVDWFKQFTFLGVELHGLPWSIDLLFISTFYFILGKELTKRLSENWLAQPWLLIASASLFTLMVYLLPSTMDLFNRSYPQPVFATITAILGILLVLSLSYQLEKSFTKVTYLIKYIGSASLIILIFHIPVQSYLAPKLQTLLGEFYSPLMVYPFAVAIPIILYAFFILPNPLLAKWYGLIKKPDNLIKP